MTPLPTRDELVQALAAVDGNQRSHWALLDRLYGPLADGVLALLSARVAEAAIAAAPACGHWVTGLHGAVVRAPKLGCRTCHAPAESEQP